MVPCARKLTSLPTLRASSSNTRMNSAPMILRFGLGLLDVDELAQEAVGGIHVDQVRVQLVFEHVDDLLAFTLAHEAVVHVHADKLLADGLDEQRCDDGAVNAAGKGQQDLLVADLLADCGNLLVDEGLGEFGGGDAHHVVGTLVRIPCRAPFGSRVCAAVRST